MNLDGTISAENDSVNIQNIKEELSRVPEDECVKKFDCTSEEFQTIEPLLEKKECKYVGRYILLFSLPYFNMLILYPNYSL